MAKRYLPPTAIQAWENAKPCDCGIQQDKNHWWHKMCGLCEKNMEYSAYEGWTQKNPLSWNVKHINLQSESITNKKENLIAVHKACNG